MPSWDFGNLLVLRDLEKLVAAKPLGITSGKVAVEGRRAFVETDHAFDWFARVSSPWISRRQRRGLPKLYSTACAKLTAIVYHLWSCDCCGDDGPTAAGKDRPRTSGPTDRPRRCPPRPAMGSGYWVTGNAQRARSGPILRRPCPMRRMGAGPMVPNEALRKMHGCHRTRLVVNGWFGYFYATFSRQRVWALLRGATFSAMHRCLGGWTSDAAVLIPRVGNRPTVGSVVGRWCGIETCLQPRMRPGWPT